MHTNRFVDDATGPRSRAIRIHRTHTPRNHPPTSQPRAPIQYQGRNSTVLPSITVLTTSSDAPQGNQKQPTQLLSRIGAFFAETPTTIHSNSKRAHAQEPQGNTFNKKQNTGDKRCKAGLGRHEPTATNVQRPRTQCDVLCSTGGHKHRNNLHRLTRTFSCALNEEYAIHIRVLYVRTKRNSGETNEDPQ